MLRSSTLPAPTDDLASTDAPASPLLCSGCSCALIFQGAAAMAVGRCAACVKRDAVAARPSIFKDSCRSGSGLLANGVTVPVRGVCTCGGKLYSRTEVTTGQCVDCDIAEQRKALATLAEPSWDEAKADAEEAQRDHDAACEPIADTLGGSL